MVSHGNVEIARTMFDQTAGGDSSRWFANVTVDFVFVADPELPAAGLRE